MAGTALPGYVTLLDVAKANGSDVTTGLIDETTRLIPEVRNGSARTIRGGSYKTWVRTRLPVTGFRKANTGSNVQKSAYQNRLVDTFILNPRIEVDKAVADRYEYGAAAYINEEGSAILEATMQCLGRQFYYGNNTWTSQAFNLSNPSAPTGPTLTFPYGVLATDLPALMDSGMPGLLDQFNSAYQYDAGGTTANTGSSAWLIKWGTKFVNWVFGENGMFQLSDVQLQRVTDSSNNPFDAYCQSVTAYPGLQLGDTRGVIRIKNITPDSGHTMTDALFFNAMEIVTAGMMPDCVAMNRRSLTQLRNSRTATNVSGAPAPIPTEIGGVPIWVTDSIQNTEPINFLNI